MLSLNCKNLQHVKIYIPCNFEVNPMIYFVVIALFSSNFKKINDRSWHTKHVCCLNLTSISYRFWNKGRELLKFRKFDEKRATTPKWVRDLLKNCTVGRSRHGGHFCNLNSKYDYPSWSYCPFYIKFVKF
jgi:hypothetical protein